MELSIERRFSRAAVSYSAHASVQRSVAHELVSRCSLPTPQAEVLEIGAGTGFLSQLMLRKFPSAKLTAVDVSAEMLTDLLAQLDDEQEIITVCADMLELAEDTHFDTIVSSSAFHWCEDLSGAFKKCSQLLKPAGLLQAAMMVEGTLGELHRLRHDLFPENPSRRSLPSVETVHESLAETGFRVLSTEERIYTEKHETVEDFFNSLRLAGVTSGSLSQGKRLLRRNELVTLMDAYEKKHDSPEGVCATYKVLFVEAVR